MTREELDSWNICLERPDARVMKDVIFDYFEDQLLSNSLQLKEENEKLHNAWIDCVERYESSINKQIIQKKKICKGCKYYGHHCGTDGWCLREVFVNDEGTAGYVRPIEKDFGCNKWEGR